MTAGIWTLLLEIGLKFIGVILDKSAADAATKKSFLDFIGSLEEKQLVSVKLKLSYAEQLAKLKEDANK